MTPKTSQASNTQTGHQAINQDDVVGDLGDTQTSQACNTQIGAQTINQDNAVGDLGDTQTSQANNSQTCATKQPINMTLYVI